MKNKDMKQLIKRARKVAEPFRVTDDKFRLKDIDPDDTLDFTSEDKPRAKEALAMGIDILAELQDRLYAQDNWAVLLIFQAMDAAGKDGAINMSCPASIHRAARSFLSSRRPARTSTTIIY